MSPKPDFSVNNDLFSERELQRNFAPVRRERVKLLPKKRKAPLCNTGKTISQCAFFAVCLLVSCVFCVGCTRKTEEVTITLPSDSVGISDEWGVVTEPYTPFFSEPETSADIVSHARRGDVLLLTGKRIADDKRVWYCFEKGWMQADTVSLYSNKMKAERAATQIK